MTIRRTGWLRRLVAAIACAALSPAASEGAVAAILASDGGPRVTVRYLGNEGVLLDGPGARVLVDALFGDGIAGYGVVPASLRDDLEAARGEFAGVDLVLATHAHADHFDADAVARFLAGNPRARFASTPTAVAAVRATPDGAALAPRLRALDPREGAAATLQEGAAAVTAFNLHHGRDRRPPIEHLGFLVEIGGRRIVHLGDTEATVDELAATGLARRRVDLALVPYWRLLGPRGRAGIREAIAPARLAVFHLPSADAPPDWWGVDGGLDGLRRALANDEPDAVLLVEPGLTRLELGAVPSRSEP